MLRVRSRTIPIRSASPGAPRNSRPRTLFPLAANAHESPAPANPFLFRSRQGSISWNPSAPRGPPFRKSAAFPPSARSFAQTALRSLTGAARYHFLFPALPASRDSLPAAATPPIRIPSPDNPPHQVAALPPPSWPCPAPKPSAPESRFPARASTAETTVHPAPAAPRPATPDPVAPAPKPRSPLPPNPLPRFDISLPAPAAARISPPARRLRSEWSSFYFPYFLTSLHHYFFVPSTGSVTRNLVPWPSRSGLSQFIFPPNSATRRATMARPSPVPCDFVVKNGCKIFS